MQSARNWFTLIVVVVVAAAAAAVLQATTSNKCCSGERGNLALGELGALHTSAVGSQEEVHQPLVADALARRRALTMQTDNGLGRAAALGGYALRARVAI